MSALRRLGQAHGIGPRYHDIWGNAHEVSESTTRALLDAMGVDAASDAAAEAALAAREAVEWRQRLAPMVVVPDGAASGIRLTVPASTSAARLRASLTADSGITRSQPVVAAPPASERIIDDEPWHALDIELAFDVPAGYYRLMVDDGDDGIAETRCAVVPHRCYRPAELRDPTWGAAVQLYGVRSARNWGIGDFTDLAEIVGALGDCGAGIVGVNPLHALFAHNPGHASPYSPSSRLFVNPLYLDVEAIAEYADCAPARELVGSPGFRARLDALREAEWVDYPGVSKAKHEVLALLYASFRERHGGRRTRRAQAFRAFKRERGEALVRQALFEAIQEHFHANDPSTWGWPAWPDAFKDPRSPAVARFAASHADRVDYYVYVQWQADLQRAATATCASDRGLVVGLYGDLAVSIDRGGAESWAHQHLYALNASVGAPPDAFNRDGQDWGLPPLVPSRLRDAGYAPFIAMLRANMRDVGALRIDHVMALMRLFWIPAGQRPADGAYVHYRFADLVGLLALESQRNRCLVIGEDLGTVPDEVRRTLAEADVLSYRVLLFERDDVGTFKPPDAYPEAALAVASTHDLPTLTGWWEGHDIEVRAKLGLIASEGDRLRQHQQRAEDRRALLRALDAAGFAPPRVDEEELTPALAESIAAYVAATRCVLNVIQIEDALLVRDQVNLPGTTDAHPNWRRKLPMTIEDALADASVRSLIARVARQRPSARRSRE